MNIPEGYVLVPVEPTDAMKDVALKWGTKKTEWEEILAAAPSVELPAYDEAKERELFGRFYSEYYGIGGSVSIKDGLNIWLASAKSRARSAE